MVDDHDRAKPYRFLLRMPEELRGELTVASSRSERSLNAEIVRRLQQSLRDEERAAARTIAIQRARRAALAVGATGVAVVAAAFSLATENGARSPARIQAASQLDAKLAQTTVVVAARR
jgi:Arc-like DNA binding dprotein